ncbi:hypothetical protein [Dactylosporangium sp. NPDC051541]|uniref:hypothetical protein n=1 Tax=Dactylosporangium sp. NPDC051541 TaxID=3363977 RepID=UPI00379C88CF
MSRRILVLAAAALGALSLAACNDGKATTASQPPASAAPSASTATSSAPPVTAKGSGSPKPSSSAKAAAASVPDICKIMSKAEINSLTGEQVTLMSDDGGSSTTTRYCQWQLSQGQVTITVNLETRENFDVRNKQAVPVVGVGTTAYSLAGHLYVWQNGYDVDVYVSSESSDSANLSVARRAAQQLLPRLEAAAAKK